MRIIHDERRETNPCFLVTGLAWGGMLAVSATALLENVLGSSSDHRVVPEGSGAVWAAGWKAAGLVGGIFLILGLLLRAAATRIATDELGIKKMNSLSSGGYLFQWTDVRSWQVESLEEASYDTDGQGGMMTRTRLVVELESAEKPLVVDQAWQTAVAAELSSVVPMRRHQDAEPLNRGVLRRNG